MTRLDFDLIAIAHSHSAQRTSGKIVSCGDFLMRRITKKAERLARALCAVESTLDFDTAFDRAHVYWPTELDKAQEIISAMNLFEWMEFARPLHGCVEAANDDKAVYNSRYTGPNTHEAAMNVVLGLEDDDG